ncbi:hypothetical protein M2132_002250 [Dysgonomonas sp. PH5-45]|uniref:hypothetical protein n=1 Tax=unclassified Dysgonomonas TaxID=2630389 RepID=UPI002473E279|nr:MULTISPECIES: hypothetical protein [unclassified Dysgonomonas]MDH6355900.1 hypothetical protein [Dysgonomonas sp. PH5-45]MDH6388792.1 hypothetical protein [Dysgonomonas sp. PH5-37]
MIRNKFLIGCIVFLFISVFTSCLDDDGSKEDIYNHPVCIQYDASVGYFGVDYKTSRPITWNGLGTTDEYPYQHGDVVYISYTIFSNKITNGIYSAKDVIINSEYKNNIQKSVIETWDLSAVADTSNAITSFDVLWYMPNDVCDDRWIFGFKTYLQGDQSVDFDIYYNRNNQPESNTKIIDVRLLKGLPEDEAGVNEKGTIVIGNLKQIRTLFGEDNPDLEKDKSREVYIKFRYYVAEKNTEGKYVVKERLTSRYPYWIFGKEKW